MWTRGKIESWWQSSVHLSDFCPWPKKRHLLVKRTMIRLWWSFLWCFIMILFMILVVIFVVVGIIISIEVQGYPPKWMNSVAGLIPIPLLMGRKQWISQGTHPSILGIHPSIPHICHFDHLYIGGEKNCHVEKFQIWIHNRCGEIRNFARLGGISKFYTWQMWRNLKFILFLVVKSVLWQFTLFFAWIVLLWFTHFCVERDWAENCIGGEKMTNMRCATMTSNEASFLRSVKLNLFAKM